MRTTQAFQEFLNGYLLGLAFTANVERTADDSCPVPLYSNPGGQISDVVNLEELTEKLRTDHPEDWEELLSDCEGFLSEAMPLIRDEFERAGGDFHLTRNGHGAGFWDGDWENGNELTKLAKPYGSFELCAFPIDPDEYTEDETEFELDEVQFYICR